jgi:hypothetical protein
VNTYPLRSPPVSAHSLRTREPYVRVRPAHVETGALGRSVKFNTFETFEGANALFSLALRGKARFPVVRLHKPDM